MKIVLLTTDLMLISAAQGAADRHDAQLTFVPNSAAAIAACGEKAARLLVVDLRTPGVDVAALVAQLRLAGPAAVRVMACGPHVHEASLAAAAAAGCDEVVTRGEFDRRLDATLDQLAR